MPYRAKAIANVFLDLAAERGVPLTPMQVQKLVYFAHGFNLGLDRGPLAEEAVEAWKWGPVFRPLYHDLVEFGSGPIRTRLTDLATAAKPGGGVVFTYPEPRIPEGEQESRADLAVVRRIWNLYGHLSAGQLSRETHKVGSPWKQVTHPYGGDPPHNLIIGNDIITDYFRRQLRTPVPRDRAGNA